eukprot:403357982
MEDVVYQVIRIQAWIRMVLTQKRLRDQLEENEIQKYYERQEKQCSPEELVLIEFKNQLVKKRITPEAFFRICDLEGLQTITVNHFKQCIERYQLKFSRGQMSRLVMILDEDMEGTITREEYYNALEAYNVTGEKHKSIDGSLYHSFEHKALFKLLEELNKKDINNQEMFNSCNIKCERFIQIKELQIFIEGLSPNFKQKETYAIINHLDIERKGTINQETFFKELSKAEILYNANHKTQIYLSKSRNNQLAAQSEVLLSKGKLNKVNLNKNHIGGDKPQGIKKKAFDINEAEVLYYFKCEDVEELISDMQFQQIFSRKLGKDITEKMVEEAFGTLQVDLDGFVDLNELVSVILKDNPNLNQISKSQHNYLVPENSSRYIQEQIINKINQQCQQKGIKILSIFRMADTQNHGQVAISQLESAFRKILIGIQEQDLQQIRKALNLKSSQDQVNQQDFLLLFQEVSNFIPNSESITRRKHEQISFQAQQKSLESLFSQEQLELIRKLDNEMLRQGMTPSVVYKSADINCRSLVSSNELMQAIKKILSQDQLSYIELKKILNAFDIKNKNSIEEKDFIDIIQYARNNQIVYTQQSKAQSMQQKQSDQQENLKRKIRAFDSQINLKKLFGSLKLRDSGSINVEEIKQKLQQSIPKNDKEFEEACTVIINTIDEHRSGLVDVQEQGVENLVRNTIEAAQNIKEGYMSFCENIDQFRKNLPKHEYSEEEIIQKKVQINKQENVEQIRSIKSPEITVKKLDISSQNQKQVKQFKNIDLKRDDMLILQMSDQFVTNFEKLTDPNLIWKALMIFQSHINKFKNYHDATYDLLQNQELKESSNLSIDQFKKLLNNYHESLLNELIEDQIYVICFLAINKLPQDTMLINVEDFIKSMRKIPSEESMIPIHKRILLNNLNAVKVFQIRLANLKLSPSKQINLEVAPKLEFDNKFRSYAPSIVRRDTFLKDYQLNEEENLQNIMGKIKELVLKLKETFSQDKSGKFKQEITQLFLNSKKQTIQFKQFKELLANHFDVKALKEQLFGEKLSCGPLTYTIIPKVDFYIQGKTTILNSEKAALVMAEKLFNLLEGSNLFIDPDFGPKDSQDIEGKGFAMYRSGQVPEYLRGSKDTVYPEQVEFTRCEDISEEGCHFMIKGAGANDVIQGKLGNCWFIGALSVLATRDEFLLGIPGNIKDPTQVKMDSNLIQKFSKGVYPPIFHNYRKKGLYVFKFFKDFKWRYVIIDDRLPCFEDPKTGEYTKIIFGKCQDPNEFWVPLIEKAYAKLHGCYEALISGFIDDGLCELTGLASEKVQIQDRDNGFPHEKIGDKLKFWKFLLQQKRQKCMLGCSAKQDNSTQNMGKIFEQQKIIGDFKTGIMTGHAYSLLDVFQIETKMGTHKLLRLRNPWGKDEWKGKWGDHQEEVKIYEREIKDQYIYQLPPEERFKLGAVDGTFMINYKNWRNIFYNLYITHDFPDEWNGVRFYGKWNEITSGGLPNNDQASLKNWAKNPQYLLELENKNVNEYDVFISLAQPDGRSLTDEKKHSSDGSNQKLPKICLLLMRVQKDAERLLKYDQAKFIEKSLLKNSREVSIRINLQAGRYLIVPCTQNMGEFTNYTLSIYMDQSFDEQNIDIKRIDKLAQQINLDESAFSQNYDEDNYDKILEESEFVDENVKYWKKKLCEMRLNSIIQVEDALINTLTDSFMKTKKQQRKRGNNGGNLNIKLEGEGDDGQFQDENEFDDDMERRDDIEDDDYNQIEEIQEKYDKNDPDEEDQYNNMPDDDDEIE